jgi:hypothetical protein
MKKAGKFSVLLMYLMAMGLILISCGGGKSAFAGKWYLVEGGGSLPSDVELLKDGTGFALEQAITWKIENNRFYLTHPSLAMAFDYKISGSRLDLTDNDGKQIVYMKLGGASAIVGTWDLISVNGNYGDGDRGDDDDHIQVLNKDGTGVFLRQKMKWAADNNSLYLLFDGGGTEKFSYQIKGQTLTQIQILNGVEYALEFKKK